MPYWRNYYHITWATQDRLPLILPAFEKQLFSYMVKKASDFEVFVYALNGTQDHVHLVVAIPPKHTVAGIVKSLKGASAHYVNHVICPADHFAWQRGYGCLTVGEKQRTIAEAYVLNQKQHHAENTSNSWLERYSEEDEGPSNSSDTHARTIHEEKPIYNQMEYPPF
jgi:putative transposase